METNPLTILQLQLPLSDTSLERAYRDSRCRMERLTARGPLRFYRRDLLDGVHQAYRQLKDEAAGAMPIRRDASKNAAPRSVVSRWAAEQARTTSPRTPRPAAADRLAGGWPEAADLSGLQPMPLRHRQVAAWKTAGRQAGSDEAAAAESSGSESLARRRRAQIEDEFCREVIYRLEGDLIRYSSRLELLRIAADRAIAPFRANLLIAQIVESVRRHQLLAGPAATPAAAASGGRSARGRCGLGKSLAVATGLLVLLADILLLRWIIK